MATILLVAEQAHGHLKKATLNALTAAQRLAAKNGGQVQGIVVGAGAQQSAQELAAYGIPVHAVEAGFEQALAETHGAAVAEAAKKLGANDVVIAATAYGKDIAPRIAVRLSAGVAPDAPSGPFPHPVKRPVWARKPPATP